MGGGCYSGPDGSACWGTWWVPLVVLAVFLLVTAVLVLGVVQVARHPRESIRYFATTRNLIILPATFFGYMLVWMLGQALASQYRVGFFGRLLLSLPSLAVFLVGLWLMRRAASRRKTTP